MVEYGYYTEPSKKEMRSNKSLKGEDKMGCTNQKKLRFYDLKNKKSFETSSYKIVVKNHRRFAVAESPSGIPSWRILGKA